MFNSSKQFRPTEYCYFATDGNYGDADELYICDTSYWTEEDWSEIEDSSDYQRYLVAREINSKYGLRNDKTILDEKFRIDWIQSYFDSQQSPEFYCEQGAHNLVCYVCYKGFEVAIYCDGEMLIKTNDVTIKSVEDLVINGILSDDDLKTKIESDDWIMNCWFDIYDVEQDNQHLDLVSYNINEAIEKAKEYLKEQYFESISS
jgi:hypothetical protein